MPHSGELECRRSGLGVTATYPRVVQQQDVRFAKGLLTTKFSGRNARGSRASGAAANLISGSVDRADASCSRSGRVGSRAAGIASGARSLTRCSCEFNFQ